MKNTFDDWQDADHPVAFAAKGEEMMASDDVKPAQQLLRDFFECANSNKPTDVAAAKLASELSRNAWLAILPVRDIFVSKHRHLLGDFAQKLGEITDKITEFYVRNEEGISPADLKDVHHYVENMRGRSRLVISLLVGEERLEADLVKRTRGLADEYPPNNEKGCADTSRNANT